MSFVDMLMYYGKTNPEKQAIILEDRVVSFGMLAAGICSVANAIRSAKIDSSHTVAVRIESPTRHLIVVSALFRLGIVSLSIANSQDLSTSGVRIDAVIVDDPSSYSGTSRVVVVQEDWFRRDFDPHERPQGFTDDNQLARIIMSSGTTATPKAIGHTARVVQERIVAGRHTLTYAPWDRMMCLPPLQSSLGFGSALQALAYGHSVVIAESALAALQMIALYSVDLLVCNPRHLNSMVAELRATPIPTPSLKLIKYGGDTLARSLATEVRERMCKDILCVYSSTESGPIAFGHIDHIAANPGSTGYVAPWVHAEILGPDHKPTPPGVEGILRVRSRWQGFDLKTGPDAANDWMYPGDLAKISADGLLSLVGRASEAVRIGQSFVAPEQIEQALYGYPGVDDVAAVAMPQAGRDPEIWLAVISQSGFDQAAMRRFLLDRNPLWTIGAIKIVPRFRRNDMGKIVRPRLREILLEQA